MNPRQWRTPSFILLCSGAIVMLSFGIRHSFGIFLRLELALSADILVGPGMSGTYAIVFGAVGKAVQAGKRSLALGILSAMASFGIFAMLPYGQSLGVVRDWRRI